MFVSDQLRQFFLRKAEYQPGPPQNSLVSISGSSDDPFESFEFEPARENDELGYAEGQSFIIEYIDAKGTKTTRRITVWEIRSGTGGCPLLVAQCHERKAKRSFRIDRIQAVFDFDGVVQEPLDEFFIEEFGLSRTVVEATLNKPIRAYGYSYSHKAADPDGGEKLNAIRAVCRKSGIPLLCLIARADSEFHHAELNVIHEYAARCCEAASIELTEADYDRLGGYIRRLRPSPNAVSRCLDQAARWTNRDIKELLEACACVVKADGQVELSELAEFGFIVENLTGRKL